MLLKRFIGIIGISLFLKLFLFLSSAEALICHQCYQCCDSGKTLQTCENKTENACFRSFNLTHTVNGTGTGKKTYPNNKRGCTHRSYSLSLGCHVRENSLWCYCDTDECNGPSQCYQCSRCSSVKPSFLKACPAEFKSPHSFHSCYIKVNEKGEVFRGCKKGWPGWTGCNPTSTKCKCIDNGCNDDTIPEGTVGVKEEKGVKDDQFVEDDDMDSKKNKTKSSGDKTDVAWLGCCFVLLCHIIMYLTN